MNDINPAFLNVCNGNCPQIFKGADKGKPVFREQRDSQPLMYQLKVCLGVAGPKSDMGDGIFPLEIRQ